MEEVIKRGNTIGRFHTDFCLTKEESGEVIRELSKLVCPKLVAGKKEKEGTA